MKKRLLSLLLVLAMVVGMLPLSIFAAQSDVAYVTIAVEGDLKLVRYPVALSDLNESGGYDLDDALSLAHNEETGMEGGYASYNDPTYGLGVSKLWGDTSMWYGYTVNGTFASGLANEVKAGDEIFAWVYTDQVYPNGNPDILAKFDKTTANVAAGEAVEVTLDSTSVANGADVVVHKLKDNHKLGAEVETDAVFDANGKASVTINEAGIFVITAAAKMGSAKALIPPYCMVTVSESTVSSNVIYTVSSAEAQPGDAVTLTVSVDHDLTAALNYWDFAAILPEDWEITGWKKPSEDSYLEIFSSGSAVSFQVGGGVQTYLPTGDLVKMTVKIPADAAPGEYSISLNHFDYENRSQNKVFDYKTICNAGAVTVKAASEAPALEDVQLVAPEGLTTEDGINYYGAETMKSYTFGYTTVPAGVEADAQSWTFADGGNNSTNGSGATIKASVWSAGKGTLTLSVSAGDKTVNKTYYIHTGAAPEPEEPAAPALEDVQLVAPEGLTSTDGTNYYGAETMKSYTFGYTTVPAGVEVDAQSWTFADGGNNSTNGSGATIKASVWSAGKGTLTLSVSAGDKTVNKTYYIHTGAAPEPEEPVAAAPFAVTVGDQTMTLTAIGKQSYEGGSECETYEVTLPAGTTAMTVSSENKMYFYSTSGSGLGLGTSKEFAVTGDVVYKINVSSVGYYYLSVKFEQTTEPETPAAPFTVTVGETVMELVSKGKQSFGEGTSECDTYEVTLPAGTTAMTVSSENKMFFYTPGGDGLGLGTSKEFEVTGDVVYKINVSSVGYYYLSVKLEQTSEPEEPENNVFVTVDLTEYEGTVDSNTFIFHDGLDDVDYDHGLIPGESKTYQYHSDDIGEYQLCLCLPYDDALLGWSLNDTQYLMDPEEGLVFDERDDDVLVILDIEEADDENGEPYQYLMFDCHFGGITGDIAAPGSWVLKPIMAKTEEPEVTEYTIAMGTSENGKVTASAEKAAENVEITLTVEADEGYELDNLTVTDASGASVTVTDNAFTMPASDVTVTATFKKVVKPYINVTVGDITAAPGETVNVPVVLDTDFAKKAYTPTYTFTAAEGAPITVGTPVAGKDVDSSTWNVGSARDGYIQFMFAGGWMGTGAVLPKGEIVLVPVTIAEDAAEGAYTLSVASGTYEWYYGTVQDGDYEETLTAGTITVKAPKATVTFALGTVSGKPGETVKMAVNVSSDQEVKVRQIGVYPSFDFDVLTYPKGSNNGIVATANDVTVGSAVTWTSSVSLGSSGIKVNNKNLKYFYLQKGQNTEPVGYEAPLPQGETFVISLKINANAQPGSYKISLPEAGVANRTFLKDVNNKLIDCNYQTADGYVIVMGTLTAPTLTTASAETTTITVAAPAACTEDPAAAVEYSVSADGGQTWSAWQTSNVFADLLSNTEYQIRARYNSELAHYGASGESNIITATTSAGQYVTIIAGSIAEAYAGETVYVPVHLETNISAGAYQPTFRFEADAGLTVGTPVAGKDLDTNVWTIQRTSDGYIQFFHYQGWMQKGGQLPQGEIILLPVTIAEDAQPGTYSVTVGSVGYEWYYYDNVTGEITNKINGTITVLEGPRKTVLDAPVLERVDAGAVTVAVTAPAASKQDPDAVLEYAISQNGITYSEWQTALRFEDLASDCTYYVIARYKAVDTVWYKDSEPSAPFEVKTLPQSATFVPTAEITIGSTVGQHGDELIIPITVEHNMTDAEFASVLLSFLVENDLTEENIQLLDGGDRNRYLGSALADDPFANSNGYFIMVGNYTALSHSYYLSYWNQGDTSATYNLPSGELFLLYIKIDENAAPGEYTIGLETKDSPKTPTFNCTDPLYGTLTDTVEVTVNKGTVTVKEPLTAPVLTDYVASDDTVTVAAPQTVEGASVEYAISEDGETYGEWQSANAFAGLKEETTYYVIARYVVKDGHTNADSYAGEPLEVKTVNPTAAYTVASVTAKSGETVELAVTLIHEIVKRATSFQLIPTAPEGLTLQSAKAGTDLGEGWKVMLNDGVVTVYRSDAAAVPSGEVVVLTYAVSKEAEDGDYTVALNENFAEDGNAFIAEDDSVLRVNGTVTAGKVTVQNIVLGDLNSDAVVDMKDLVSLRRYLAGWTDYNAETLNLSTIDLNEDGVVNMLDAIILSRHLAGWPDYETIPFVK